ncbi:MAG: enoyl-CoA hydratase/isomerase family protein [Candidatus Melainabacteria bacterium]|nr:enoyl-CoA hydratase/isomerase family protein [Candidatus Melainabacteria bacterium]
MSYTFIETSEKNGVGFLTLNSPKSLNSLSAPMMVEYRDILKKWKSDPNIHCIYIQGAGEKALCAGGDVRRMHDDLVKHNNPDVLNQDCVHFFTQEYALDYEVHTFAKPIVVWANGIVMGGGIGATNGASNKIVTEHSVLAMPEITIGLYPDVGATYFLNKMPAGIGTYLAMTANRINAADALYLKMAEHFLPAANKQKLIDMLTGLKWTSDNDQNKALVTSSINEMSNTTCKLQSKVQEHEDYLGKFKNVKNAFEFREVLYSNRKNDDWQEAGLNIFRSGSPVSAHVIMEQLKRGASLSLKDVFKSELNLSLRFTMKPDFVEGVRALLVDKDKHPRWRPVKLEQVSEVLVESYFEPLWSEDSHPFNDL